MRNDTILVLGGTGKTGRRIAARLRERGVPVRTAARHDADVAFDWHDPATHDAALAGVSAVYLVPPAQRLDYAPAVAAFLDRAQAAGVRHVTSLSARGVDELPPEVTPRAVELDLAGRLGLTHAVLRPAWFMQNFNEALFLPAGGTLAAPTGDGAEAIVHADDIAEVAVATLLAPADHDGAGYTLTGPEALTFGDVAARIAKASGRSVVHDDVATEAWVDRQRSSGMPDDYAQLLGGLLAVVREGGGATPTDDVERVTGHAPRSVDDYTAEQEPLAAWSRIQA
jgi:uncharacterized protein YbjT (DUF2867 family)